MNITEELQKVIVKSLPEATANEMRTFIEDAEQTKIKLGEEKKANTSLNDLVTKHRKTIETLEKLVETGEKLDQYDRDLTIRSNKIDAREQKLDMILLETKLEAMTSEKETVISLVNKVFGVPTVTVNNSKSGDILTPIPVSNTGMIGTVQRDFVVDSETTTTTTGKE